VKGQELAGSVAARLLDRLDESTDETAEIEEVLIIVRITTRDDGEGEVTDEDDPGWSFIQWEASDPVWTHQLGLITGALEGMQAGRAGRWRDFRGDEDDD